MSYSICAQRLWAAARRECSANSSQASQTCSNPIDLMGRSMVQRATSKPSPFKLLRLARATDAEVRLEHTAYLDLQNKVAVGADRQAVRVQALGDFS